MTIQQRPAPLAPMVVARDPAQLTALTSARDLSLREMGLLVGCSRTAVQLVLDGQRINSGVARRFAKVLRRSVHELFESAPDLKIRRAGVKPQAVA